MYISDLDYLESPFENRHYSDLTLVQGGIDFSALAQSLAVGEKTAITFAVTRTAAVSLGFGL